MRLSNEETLKKLLDAEEIYVLFSAAADLTQKKENMPPKLMARTPLLLEKILTFQIQALVYDSKAACEEVAKNLFQRRILAMGLRFEKKDYRPLFLNLAENGVEILNYHTGEDMGEVSMSEEAIQSLIALKEVNQAQRNLSRDVVLFRQQMEQNMFAKDQKPAPGAKEKEKAYFNRLSGSMMRGAFLVPVLPDKANPGKLMLPVLPIKDDKGNITERQLMVFTNPLELTRQFGQRLPECRMMKLADLAFFMEKFADSLVINKATSGIRINKEGVLRMKTLQDGLDAADRGEKELDAETVHNHLLLDDMLYTIYTINAIPGPDGKPIFTPRNPYIVEDQESFNDQTWIFADLEEAKAYMQKVRDEKKIPVSIRSWHALAFDALFSTLLSKSINSAVYVRNGKKFELELDQLGTLPDYSAMEEKDRPLVNPTLGLCAQYYWQEINHGVRIEDRSEEEKEVLMDKATEFMANLKKSNFYIRYDYHEKDGKMQPAFPMVTQKDAEGNVISAEYQLFSDIFELEKFFGENAPKTLKVPFALIGDLMQGPATGIVLDPAGVEFHIAKNQIEALLKNEM